MRLLLDSHVLVWIVADPDRLPAQVKHAIIHRTDELFVSLASIWELANKVALGRLPLIGTSVPAMIESFEDLGVTTLAITQQDVVAAATLPPHHLDPFDRMLVAQAQASELVLVTSDHDIRKYDVTTLWH